VKTGFFGCDNILGGELAAKYLFEKGHRKIGLITGPAGQVTAGVESKALSQSFIGVEWSLI